jgi:hypothetical protein
MLRVGATGIHGWMDVWMDGRKEGKMGGWVGGWMDGWMETLFYSIYAGEMLCYTS